MHEGFRPSSERGIQNLGLLDPKYCLPNEAGAVASVGMLYCHIPVKFDAPTVEDPVAVAPTPLTRR